MADDIDPTTLSPAKRALYELRTARARVAELERAQHEPIAIVGLGLRFPGGVSDPDALWQLLRDGRDAVTEIPADRWSIEQFFDADPDAPGKMYTRHGAFLDNVDQFDPRFFGVSPREAATMDPQQRLLLEVAWEALERAGQNPEQIRDGGVFLALSNSDYSRLVLAQRDEIDAYSSTGNNFSVAAGRLSYLLGWRGPSLVVDTACSGSLVAVHLACQSLRTGECGIALAGGVNLMLTPEIHINFSKSRMMATDGRCKTFDASADGYVRGEGCGIVVLKRLSDAIASEDHVLAVIRGSAVNQDGRSGGLTVPNGPAQESVIRKALTVAQIEPNDVGYIEAHGTGTALGDPIEAHALAAVFGADRSKDHPLVVGSLKTNLGHLEAAAGIAGLIKAVLSLEHETIPAHLHFREMNPHIDWGGMPVEIPVQARAWPHGQHRRVAGVSSFGFSGTNAHVVLEEAPGLASNQPHTATQPTRSLQLLTLSARTPSALEQLRKQYRAYLAQTPEGLGQRVDETLADICFTANTGRTHFSERAVFLASTREGMHDALAQAPIARGVSETQPDIVFLFTGQGSQWAGMGRELYDTAPPFRDALDRCAAILDPHLDHPLLEILYGSHRALLDETRYTQPALFALEWALAQLWQSWGITPAAVFGHSVGEYVALCVAGVWTLEDALSLIAHRGSLMHNLGSGWGMTAVQSSAENLHNALAGLAPFVSMAAVNGPDNFVVSGRDAELQQAEARLQAVGARVTRLNVSHGFHSAQMEDVAAEFARRVAATPFHAPRTTVISSVTGRAATLDELQDPTYWRQQVRNPVQFQTGMETLAQLGFTVFLEVGPAPVLIGMGQQCVRTDAVWAASLRKDRSAWDQMLTSLGQLYVQGASVDWNAFEAGETHHRVVLPTYPFERQRFWIEQSTTMERSTPAARSATASWETIHEATTWQARQGRLDLSVERYQRGWDVLERLTNAYITTTLSHLGAFQAPGTAYSADTLAAQLGIKPSFTKLLERWLERLVSIGILRKVATEYIADRPLTPIAIEPLLREADTIFGDDRIFLDYVVACGSQLQAYITGTISTLETLFPGGSFDRAEDLYERAPVSAYFSGIGRAGLDALVRTRRGGPVRVVEIGAGTGATTSALVPVFAPEDVVYHFTDISDFFLNHAREKFARYDFMRYGRFDIEQSGAEQGYPDGTFDVVIATNALHATRDLRQTLQHVRTLLAPGGVLLLCEATTYLPWFDITTGLIEGWQLFADGLRGDHPLLPAEQWIPLLREAGFEYVAALPEAGSPAEVLGQHVILAQVPGQAVIVQPVRTSQSQASPTPTPSAPADDLLTQLQAAPPTGRHELLVGLVRTELARALRIGDPETLERHRRLIEFGIDSLMAVELRNRLTTVLHLAEPLPATLIFDHPSIEALAEYLEQDVLRLGSENASTEQTPSSSSTTDRARALEELSEEEAEALLLRRLQSLT